MAQFPLPKLGEQLRGLGAEFVLVRRLVPNNNSKNQIYVGRDISELSLLSPGEIECRPGASEKRGSGTSDPIYHAPLNLWWLTQSGNLMPAPYTKLVLHPQYGTSGEVRLSGFVRGCSGAPSHLFDIGKEGRTQGRALVLAPLKDGRVVAVAFGADTQEAEALHQLNGQPYAVFHRFELTAQHTLDAETELLAELYRIHMLDWLNPEYLEADGSRQPCKGSNCGGVTLETHLGIRANGSAEPDFRGWEVKQHGVGSLARPRAGAITLFTPEPTGGHYVTEGPEYFVRTWGYADLRGREDRMNFGGVHRVSDLGHHPRTNLRLTLVGYDPETEKLRADGEVALVDSTGAVAATWSFAKLMDHWRRKHSNAAFVPSEARIAPTRQYRYGADVMLGKGAYFRRLLRAFQAGVVYYDPGLKLEQASSSRPVLKRRSQFRVNSADLASLYESFREVQAGPRQ